MPDDNKEQHSPRIVYKLYVSSVTSGRIGSNYKDIIFQLPIHSSSLSTGCTIVLMWMLDAVLSKNRPLLMSL